MHRVDVRVGGDVEVAGDRRGGAVDAHVVRAAGSRVAEVAPLHEHGVHRVGAADGRREAHHHVDLVGLGREGGLVAQLVVVHPDAALREGDGGEDHGVPGRRVVPAAPVAHGRGRRGGRGGGGGAGGCGETQEGEGGGELHDGFLLLGTSVPRVVGRHNDRRDHGAVEGKNGLFQPFTENELT